jgi:hypothetical protein
MAISSQYEFGSGKHRIHASQRFKLVHERVALEKPASPSLTPQIIDPRALTFFSVWDETDSEFSATVTSATAVAIKPHRRALRTAILVPRRSRSLKVIHSVDGDSHFEPKTKQRRRKKD